ncbi:exopolysaccharide biosynthesis polyprenyl glycosylphosphotransferase [Vibrio breoganii]
MYKNPKRFLVKKINIFCHDKYIDKVKATLKYLEIEIQFNNYSISLDNTDGIICHYRYHELSEEKSQFLVDCLNRGAWVEPLSSFIEGRYGYMEAEILHSGYFLHQKSFSILTHQRNKVIKRIIDLGSAISLLILSLPISLVTMIAIKLESPGPVFFKQKRTGLFNKEFEVIKFRSMRNDAEKNGAQWATKNDARVTKIGAFIRKTRIDELPQLINVLKGEMSMVGPRPEREVFIETLEKSIPYYRFRHAVKPGITGLAQVRYPYGASLEDAIWKHKYDMYYIKHQSYLQDIKILLLTVKVVLFGMGR